MKKTFGEEISAKRKELLMSQKELANQVKKENGSSISPQYLNDIEKDRRAPSDYILGSLAKILNLDADYLCTTLDKLPPSLKNISKESLKKAIELHRKSS
ncbi:MAG: XRE family transcriptional regulator [Alphaproteobacteria bacterium]|nr:XRE family transcriptional regulator [Alphaproteobacteria bacterium]